MREAVVERDGIRVSLAGRQFHASDLSDDRLGECGEFPSRIEAIRGFEKFCRQPTAVIRTKWLRTAINCTADCLHMTADFSAEQMAAFRADLSDFRQQLAGATT